MQNCKVEGCANKYRYGGFCNAHYLRNLRYGDPLIKKKKWKEKLNYKITQDGCYEVISHKPGNHGYPLVSYKGKSQPAHRKVYEEMFAEIPKGFLVRHKCDNRICVNPEHLELGTFEDNMNDKVERGRQAKGEGNASSKLKEWQVKEIKWSLREKRLLSEKVKYLAEKYNISISTVNDIYYRKTWKHIKVGEDQ